MNLDSKQKKIHKVNQQVLYQINTLLLEQKLVTPNQRILIAVSGGQDSICVLNILYQLNISWNWTLGMVYCDHRWNKDSEKQGLHISELASNMKIHFYQVVSTETVASETLARNWRYKSIKRIAICHDYHTIVTGHSATDRIETLLCNLFRGSGTIGLQSLSWRRELNQEFFVLKQGDQINVYLVSKHVFCSESVTQMRRKINHNYVSLVRPLLKMTRTELTEYVLMLQLPIWQDFTNKDLRIQRNRIRHQLLPYLRRYLNPNVDRVLSNWTEIVHTETLFFESLVNNIAPKLRTLSDSLTTKEIDKEQQIKLSVLQSLPIAIQRRILKECVSNIDQFKHTSHFEHLERIRTFYQHRHK